MAVFRTKERHQANPGKKTRKLEKKKKKDSSSYIITGNLTYKQNSRGIALFLPVGASFVHQATLPPHQATNYRPARSSRSTEATTVPTLLPHRRHNVWQILHRVFPRSYRFIRAFNNSAPLAYIYLTNPTPGVSFWQLKRLLARINGSMGAWARNGKKKRGK